VIGLLVLHAAGHADEGAAPAGPAPSRARLLLAFLPGGGQLLLGEPGAGAGYLGATLGFAGWGWWAWGRRGPGELDVPLVWAQHVYVVSAYSAYRDLSLRLGQTERLDPASVPHLIAAPFRPAALADPWVLGFAALGAGVNWLTLRLDRGDHGWRDVTRMRYLGGTAGHDAVLPAYAAYWIPLSCGAGVAEEMLFRGMLQADWEERWGNTPGWLAASGAFGLAHVTAVTRPAAWAQGGFAALAGLFLGWRYQRTGYRLAEPIAAHAWFDIAAGLAIFLADPRHNPLGARVEFRM